MFILSAAPRALKTRTIKEYAAACRGESMSESVEICTESAAGALLNKVESDEGGAKA